MNFFFLLFVFDISMKFYLVLFFRGFCDFMFLKPLASIKSLGRWNWNSPFHKILDREVGVLFCLQIETNYDCS